MKSTLVVSERGQITLPASVRKRVGMEGGGVVTLEEVEGKLVLTPAAVMPIEMYSQDQVASWDKEDRFEAGEKQALLGKLAKGAQ